jgi:ATP-binding cassette subfamily C (CFTR/MRP) protein 1
MIISTSLCIVFRF